MSYHPDPHGELGWEDFEVFNALDDEIMIPDMLAASFSGVLADCLHKPKSETVIELIMVYADLTETLPERQVQLALKQAAPTHFADTLAYAQRPDLTGAQETHELI